jgi:hypothetical protein
MATDQAVWTNASEVLDWLSPGALAPKRRDSSQVSPCNEIAVPNRAIDRRGSNGFQVTPSDTQGRSAADGRIRCRGLTRGVQCNASPGLAAIVHTAEPGESCRAYREVSAATTEYTLQAPAGWLPGPWRRIMGRWEGQDRPITEDRKMRQNTRSGRVTCIGEVATAARRAEPCGAFSPGGSARSPDTLGQVEDQPSGNRTGLLASGSWVICAI